MADLISQLENHISGLRSALQQSDNRQIDRECQSLETILLENDDYQFVGNERLLAEADDLLTQAFGESAADILTGLRKHLARLRVIHDKFYAVLDPQVDLETLLLDHLSHWPTIESEIESSFTDTDKARLHETRTSGDSGQKLKNFFEVYLAHLREQGQNEIVINIEAIIRQALEGFRYLCNWQTYVLFVSGGNGQVYGIKASILANGEGKIESFNNVGDKMEKAARRALGYIHQLHPHTRKWDFRWEIARDDIPFDGQSIGLGLALILLSQVEKLDIDTYTAFTGCVDDQGNVKRIENLQEKLQAAQRLGIRRVFIPQENAEDCESVVGLEITAVTSVQEAKQRLQNRSYLQESTSLERLAQNKIQLLETELKQKNIRKVSQKTQNDSCIRVEFSDGRDTIVLLVYHAQQIKPVSQGKSTPLKRIVEIECDKIFGSRVPQAATSQSGKPETRRYKVWESQLQHKLEQHLINRGDSVQEEETNCRYRIRITKGGQTVFVRQFTNGTLTVAGSPPLLDEVDDDVRSVANIPAPQVGSKEVPQSKNQQTQLAKIEGIGEAWIGTDEAGKGDYFGPLVGAAVFVDEPIVVQLRENGVKDSKALSDKRNRELAAEIHRICGKRAQVVTILPERYNTLYADFQREGKNLNWLLAWAHTRALENILVEYPQEQIAVVVDKFGDEHLVQGKLLSQARKTKLNLVQVPKAETNIAVAAASILARAHFLRSLARMSEQYGIEFPKGSSDPQIIRIGKQIVERQGEDELRKVAKWHFATTRKILGQ